MKNEEELIAKFGKDSGMRVPEGYFLDLQGNIMNSLPPYKKAPVISHISAWHRVKPYVYRAAMFCGIWLMMKVFHTATQPMSLSLDNPPQALVELVDGDMDFDVHYMPQFADFDLEDEDLFMSYDSFEEFEKDFGYTLKPEYSTVSYEKPSNKKS